MVRWVPGRFAAAVVAAIACAALVAQAAPSADAAPSGGALVAPQTLVVSTFGAEGVPFDAIGVALNVTVTEPVASGFLTVYPCNATRPLASNLNYVAGQTVPNLVITAVGDFGDVCIDTMATTDVVVDLAGYVPAGSELTMLPAPVRFLDTREPGSVWGGRLRAGEVRRVQIAGHSGVPNGVRGAVFNATAVDASARGYLTVFPCDQPVPATSTLNVTTGAIVPNLVVTALAADGSVCFTSNVDMDLVGDVAGHVAATASSIVFAAAPQRIVDSRIGLGAPAALVGSPATLYPTIRPPVVPSGATGAIVNLTATEGTAAGWASAYPCFDGLPLASNLNFAPGQDVANLAVVDLDGSRQLCLFANRPVHLIADLVAWLRGPAAIVPVRPQRLFDTREGWEPACQLGIVALGDRWRWQDLGTGTLTAALPPAYRPDNSTVLDISPDCGTVRVAAGGTVATIDRAGRQLWETPVVLPPQPGGIGIPVTLIPSDYGVYGLSSLALVPQRTGPITLYDVEAGEVWIEFTELDRLGPTTPWKLLGTSRDLSRIVFWRWDAEARPELFVFDDVGTLIGTGRLPSGAQALSLSPDGGYVSFSRQGPVPSGGTASIDVAVATLDGTVVSTVPLAFGNAWLGSDARWWSTGSMMLCARTGGPTASTEAPVRWNLFGTPNALYPARPDVPCPRVIA